MALATVAYTEPGMGERAPIRPSFVFRTGVSVIVLVTMTWRFWTVSQWSWFQDDWIYLTRSAEMPFVDFIFQNYNGHIMPAQFSIVWVMTHVAPLDYSFALTTVVLFSGALLIAWSLALREIFGERARLLYPIFLLGLSPLFMPVSLWWAAAMQVYPLILFMGLTVLFVARFFLRGQRWGDLLGVLVAYTSGLLFWEKALLIVIPASFMAVFLSRGSLGRRIRGSRPALLVLFGASAVYIPIYVLMTRSGDSAETELLVRRGATESFTFFATGLLDVGVPTLLGGPWSTIENPQQVFASSSGVLTLLFLTLIVVASTMAVRIRRDGALAIAMGFTYAIVSWGLVFTSSRFDAVGIYSVRDARYAADILPVVLLALSLLATPTRAESRQGWMRQPLPGSAVKYLAPISVLTFICVAGSAMVTNGKIWDASASQSPKTWTDNLISDTQSAEDVSVYDSMAPGNVILSAYFWGDGRLSRLLAPLEHSLVFDQPADDMYTADWAGHLKQVDIEAVSRSAQPGPVEGCGYLVSSGETTRIPLDNPMYDWQWGYQLDYFSAEDAGITVRTSSESLDLELERGLHHRQFVVEDAAESLEISSRPGSSAVCITEVRVGPLVASDRWVGDVPEAAP